MPVYSVDTEEEAYNLLLVACSRNAAGEFVARELAEEQTLGKLAAFSDRLAEAEATLRARATARKR